MRSSKSGVTIVMAIVGILALAGAAIILAGLFTFFRQSEERSDRRALGQQVMVDTSMSLINMDFDAVKDLCKSRGATDATMNAAIGADVSAQGKCIVANQLSTNSDPAAGVAQDANNSKILDVRKKFSGEPDMQGLACVQLKNCKTVGTTVLDLTITGVWPDPDSRLSIIQRDLTFRKVKW